MLTSSDRALILPVLKSIGAYVYLVDVLDDGTFRYFAINWPENMESLLPYTGSVIGKRPEEVVEAERAARINERFRYCIESRKQIEFEGEYDTAAGKHWTNHLIAPIFDLTGCVVRIMGTIIDITKRKLAENALHESEARFRAFYDNNPAKFTAITPDGMILSMNHFGAQFMGYDRREVIGMSLFQSVHEADKSAAKQLLRDVIQTPGLMHRAELRIIKKDGSMLWMSNSARLTEDEKGNQVILIVSEDTTGEHELSEKLLYQATHDSLTGLINRREFEHRLEQMLESAKQDNVEHALCYLDLDQFKILNDTCGHVAGDELLRRLGRFLQEKVRSQDTLARLGGDEFGILLPQCPLKEAVETSAMFCKAIEGFHFPWKERSFSLGVSIGVVSIAPTSGDVTAILTAADRACYVAKEMGRNRVHVYRPGDSEIEERSRDMAWVHRIKHAIADERLHLYFQPIIPVNDKGDGRHRYELLLRLEDEEGRLVLPGTFLPAAERYNLAPMLDKWVVKNAFDWLSRHPEHLDGLSLCSINLSGATMGDNPFLRFVMVHLQETRIPPEKICFEITETAAIMNLAVTHRFIETLMGIGCCFSLDDFGSGLSSFHYLKSFPVKYLKIDGGFIKDVGKDPTSMAMVKSINEIGHVMGKETIAEYVDNDAILEIIRNIGVDYCQGYGIGHPQPLSTLSQAVG